MFAWMLTQRLTSESGEGKNRAAMITSIQLDTCVRDRLL